MRFIILFFCLAGSVLAYDASEESSFELPADWASIRSNIDTSFSCVGRAYGYYADVSNDCQLYHVCQPRIENEVTVYRHDPFICPLNTVFDQRSLSCVHSTPEFSCVDSVQYYADTENHYANVAPVEHHVVTNEVVYAPPVNEHVVSQPIPEVASPVVPNTEVYSPEVPVVAEVAVPVVAEVPVARSVVTPVVVENHPVLSNESSEVASPVVHNEVSLNITPVVPVVRSNDSFNDQRESAEVSHVLPVVHTVNPLPIMHRMMQQTQENLVMEPVKGVNHPVKRNIYRQVQQLVEQPIKKSQPMKAPLQQQVVQPAKTVSQQNVEPVKAPLQQQVVQPAKTVSQQNVQPMKSQQVQQLVEQPVKKSQPIKSQQVQQLVEQPVKKSQPMKAPLQQQVVQPAKTVSQQNVEPVKAPLQQQVVQPAKTVSQQNVQPIKQQQVQQLVEQPVKKSQPIKSQQSVQQLVEQPIKAPQPAKTLSQQNVQPIKAPQPIKSVKMPIVRQQTQQLVEMPRKSNGPFKQEVMHRSYVPHTVYYNGAPSWRHHYYRLRPHLVHYNERSATRWV